MKISDINPESMSDKISSASHPKVVLKLHRPNEEGRLSFK